jgi:hypothetical protein
MGEVHNAQVESEKPVNRVGKELMTIGYERVRKK